MNSTSESASFHFIVGLPLAERRAEKQAILILVGNELLLSIEIIMLRLLYVLTFRVFVVSLALISTARFIGVIRHDPLIPLFTNPDGSSCEMPCLLGIRPGETTFEDAVTIVQKHPMTHNLQLFAGDFTGVPTGGWGNLFHSPNWSVLFMGQGGHAVALQIHEGRYEGYSHTGIDYDFPVQAVCLKSVFNNATTELPQITTEFALLWHRTSFFQMVATLGNPQSVSSPTIAPTGAWSGSTRIESFYYDDRLVLTHSADTYEPPEFNHNFLDSVCVYAIADFNARFNTGFHGRVGAVVPWLGVYASTQDYYDWMGEHPATEPVRVMP